MKAFRNLVALGLVMAAVCFLPESSRAQCVNGVCPAPQGFFQDPRAYSGPAWPARHQLEAPALVREFRQPIFLEAPAPLVIFECPCVRLDPVATYSGYAPGSFGVSPGYGASLPPTFNNQVNFGGGHVARWRQVQRTRSR